MITFKRYILTLVALLAMTTGAWADGTLLTTINASADFTNGSKTFDNIVTVTLYGVYYDANYGWYYPGSPSPVVVAPVNGVTVTGYVLYFSATDPLEYEGSSFEVALEGNRVLADDISTQLGSIGITKIEVYGTAAPAGPSVTLDETKTVATMAAMPAYDATVSYELVRDLSESVNFLGIPTGNGATVKKDVDKYTFATAPIITLSDVLNPSDAITIFYYNDGFSYVESGLTLNVYPMVEMEGKWKADETATPVALADFLASPQPGRWMIKATAETGLYDGTLYSPEFTLAEAYDLTLSPATDANLKSVTVAGTAKTADEKGVIRGIEPTKKVKITTTGPDYIIRKATVKKTPKANE